MLANTILFKQADESVSHGDQDPGSFFNEVMKSVRSLHPYHWFDDLWDDIKIDLEDVEFLEKNIR